MKKLLLYSIAISGLWIIVIYVISKSPNVEKEETYEEQEKESGADKQMSSWWWARAYPEGENINEKYYNGWLQAESLKENGPQYSGIRSSSDISLFSGNWMPIGPNQNIGG